MHGLSEHAWGHETQGSTSRSKAAEPRTPFQGLASPSWCGFALSWGSGSLEPLPPLTSLCSAHSYLLGASQPCASHGCPISLWLPVQNHQKELKGLGLCFQLAVRCPELVEFNAILTPPGGGEVSWSLRGAPQATGSPMTELGGC